MDYYDSTGRFHGWYGDFGYLVEDTHTDNLPEQFRSILEAEDYYDVTFRGAA